MAHGRTFQLDAFFDSNMRPIMRDDVRDLFARTDVIFGLFVMGGDDFIVSGRERVAQIANGTASTRIAVFTVECDPEELKRLLSLIEAHKGSHDYLPELTEPGSRT